MHNAAAGRSIPGSCPLEDEVDAVPVVARRQRAAAAHTITYRRHWGEAVCALVLAAVFALNVGTSDVAWLRTVFVVFAVAEPFMAVLALRRRLVLSVEGVALRGVRRRRWRWDEVVAVRARGPYQADLRLRIQGRWRPLVLNREWQAALDGVGRPRGEVSGHALALWTSAQDDDR